MPLRVNTVSQASGLSSDSIANGEREAWGVLVEPHWEIGDAVNENEDYPKKKECGEDVGSIEHGPAYMHKESNT